MQKWEYARLFSVYTLIRRPEFDRQTYQHTRPPLWHVGAMVWYPRTDGSKTYPLLKEVEGYKPDLTNFVEETCWTTLAWLGRDGWELVHVYLSREPVTEGDSTDHISVGIVFNIEALLKRPLSE